MTKTASTKKATKVAVKTRKIKEVTKVVHICNSLCDGFIVDDTLLKIKTGCRIFGSPKVEKDSFFLRQTRTNCMKKCSPEVKEACFAKKFSSIEFVKEIKESKKATTKRIPGTYQFPKDTTQAFKIDNCLKFGETNISEIAQICGVKNARVTLRVKSIKKRANCPDYAIFNM